MPFNVTTAITLLQTFQLWPKRQAQTPGSDNRRRLLEHVSVRTSSGLLTEIVVTLLYFVVNHTHRTTATDTRQNVDVEFLVAVTVGCSVLRKCQTTCEHLFVRLQSFVRDIYRRYGTQRLVVFFLIEFSFAVVMTTAYIYTMPHATRMWFREFVTRLDDSIVTVDLDKRVLYVQRAHPKIGGLRGPFVLVKQTRFPTEDARFYCSFEILTLEEVESFRRQVWWNKDGNQLEPSHRVMYDVTFEPSVRPLTETEAMAGHRWYRLTSTLSIYVIDDNDFGSYTCHFMNFLRIVPNPHIMFQPNRESHTYSNNLLKEYLHQEHHTDNAKAEFQLIKQETTTESLVMPPGGIVKVTALHMTLEEGAEVKLYHTVNGLGEYSASMCSGHEYLCSPAVMMYHFWKYPTNAFDGILHFKHSSIGPTTVFFYNFCVCSMMLGVHEFHVIRRVFNFTSKKYDFVETVYPKRLKIFPQLPETLGILENENVKNSSSLETCWLENRNTDSPICSRMLAEIQARTAGAFIADLLEVIAFIMIVVIIAIFIIWKSLLLIRNIILEGGVHPVVLPSLCGNPVDFGDPLQTGSDYICEYDVFLVYSEKDRFMLHILKTCLTLNGLRVFDCHGDVQPGRQTVEVWDEILEKTASSLVVVSRNLTDNKELQDLFLTLHNRVLCSEMSVNRLLIVKIDTCPVSSFLGPLPFIDLSSGEVSLSNCRRMMDRWSDIAQRRIVHKRSHFKLLLWHDLKKELNRVYFLHRPLTCLRPVPSENAVLHPLSHVELVTENITQFDYDVFFSYVEEDADVAMEIKARLTSGGLRVFDTCDDVMLHEFPQIAIPHAVGHSASFVFIVSPEYCRQPLSCRLHFRLVWHQIWNTGSVKVEQVLLVKLGVWSVPAALRQFPLLDWNSSLLTPQDRLMTLDKWSVTALRNEKNQDLKRKKSESLCLMIPKTAILQNNETSVMAKDLNFL